MKTNKPRRSPAARWSRARRQARWRSRADPASAQRCPPAAPRTKGSGGVPGPRPDRYRRGLRQRRLCLQLQDHRRAARLQQPDRAVRARQARARQIRAGRDRARRHLQGQAAERAGADFHPRRKLARRPRRAVHHLCRAVREGGREFRGGRFHQCARDRRRHLPDGRPVPARGRLDLPQRQELRRQSRRALSHQPLVRQPSGELCSHHRMGEAGPAAQHPERAR